ncbi:MAG: flagellin [Caulobacterales bacterium]
MAFSVNTNPGALIALQNLNATANQLQQTQQEISTGLHVATAKDNGAVWAIAQNERSEVLALDAVKQSLQRGQSVADVASSAGSTVSDLLNQLKATALSASDTSLDPTSRSALNTQFQALLGQITSTINNAAFNGANLLDGSLKNVQLLANSAGTATITIGAQTLVLGKNIITVAATTTIGTATLASAALVKVNASIINTNNALAALGTASKALDTHLTFVDNLQDTLTTGVGNLVNADLARASATLQALQTKQQLGVQALSIANSATSALLTLFR